MEACGGPRGQGPGLASSREGSPPPAPLPSWEEQTALAKRTQDRLSPKDRKGPRCSQFVKSGWSPGGENGSSIFIKSTINTLPL